MRIKYFDINITKDTPTNELKVFADLSKYRLFMSGSDYRLSSLWNGCKTGKYRERYCLAVAYRNKIPVGVVCYEPDDKSFLSCYIKPKYRGKHLASKLASIVIKQNKFPTIWCLAKSQDVLRHLGYRKNSKTRKMEYEGNYSV